MLGRKLPDLLLLTLIAIPVAFVPLHLLQAEHDLRTDPNFALLGLAGAALALVGCLWVRRNGQAQRWPWALAGLACLAVSLVAAGSFDWGGGGH